MTANPSRLSITIENPTREDVDTVRRILDGLRLPPRDKYRRGASPSPNAAPKPEPKTCPRVCTTWTPDEIAYISRTYIVCPCTKAGDK